MTDTDAPEWPDPADKAHAVEQAKRLRDQAAKGGLRFEAYLPPGLAEWLLDRIERGKFLDPSEAVFVILGEHEELEPHADLRQELFKRSIQAAADDPRRRSDETPARVEHGTATGTGQMGKAVPALTHRGFVTGGPPAHYSATLGRVRLRRAGHGSRRSATQATASVKCPIGSAAGFTLISIS